MSKWKMVKLGDVCKFINGDRGKNYPSGKDIVENGIPFINAGHLVNNEISFSSMNYITEDKYNQLGSGKIQKGDFLYCLRGSLGKHAIVENLEKGAVASSLVILRPTNIDVHYLSYCMDSPSISTQLQQANNGSSQPNLSANSVKQYIVPLPPLEEQKRIADILDKASNLIDLRKQQLEKMDLLIKSKFIDMFGEYLIKNINSKRLPEVTEFIDYRGRTPEKSNKGIPLITAKNVKDNAFSVEPQEFIPEENYNEVMTRGIPKINDVLFTTEAPLGNVCRIPHIFGKFCVGQRLITMQPVNGLVTSEFLEYVLLSKEFKDEMWKKSSGSTVKGIRSKELAKLTIPVPPIELQNDFAAFVEQVEKQKAVMQQSFEKMETNYKALMQEYFG